MYGTIADVKLKLKQFQQLFDREAGYLHNEITDALEEATLYANQLLVKRYDLAVIAASVPDLVTEFAVNKACAILSNQLPLSDMSVPTELIQSFEKRIKSIATVFLDGDLLDNSNNIIDYTLISELIIPDVAEDDD
jgi:hypothetical protein